MRFERPNPICEAVAPQVHRKCAPIAVTRRCTFGATASPCRTRFQPIENGSNRRFCAAKEDSDRANAMRRFDSKPIFIGFLVLICISSLAIAKDPVAEIGTSEELHALYNDGKYQPLLQKIAKILALRGDA